MTVHKSQGSEFNNLALVLPADRSGFLDREIIYTGLTRGRRRVEVFATAETIASACRHRQLRMSGLLDKLLQYWAG